MKKSESMGRPIKGKIVKPEVTLNKPSTGRIVATVFIGIFVTICLCLTVVVLYTKWVKYPPREKLNETETGIYCLNNWVNNIRTLESTGKDSYLYQEISYANGNENQVNFCKKMTATVEYTPKESNVKNIYGNDYKDNKGNVIVEESSVHDGEEVILKYIDYDNITFDINIIKEIMSQQGVKYGDVDYENKLVSVFCIYMNNLQVDSLPVKEIEYIPNIEKLAGDNFYTVLPEEDEYLDKLLFSSESFFSLLDRFSESAAKACGVDLKPSNEWSTWNKSKNKDSIKEPNKYNTKESISKKWCGSYYLQNEYVETEVDGTETVGISAEVGDGTFKNPAGLNTDVITYVYVSEKGKDVSYPIRVTLKEYGVSQEAIDWIESKDTRNRGIDVNSKVQYCYMVFEVTNLSNKTLTINDNSALCDSNVNTYSRTGVIYGLQDSVTLKPDETGLIETWNKSTELNTKYVIWGGDFARRCEPVWFRLLAGNIDDSSENKGVSINNSQEGEDIESSSTDSNEE